jgi:hypothetical protein
VGRYEVVAAFRRLDGELVQPPGVVELPVQTGRRLTAAGCVRPLDEAPRPEVAVKAQAETATRPSPVHMGGGWYQVGETRIRGREAAERIAAGE